MIAKVKVPKLSANVEEATVTAWFKREGDTVRRGEALLEMTTDKASFEIEAPRAGMLRRILAKEKSVLPVGYVVALVGGASDALPDVADANERLLRRRRRAGAQRRMLPGTARARRAPVRATPAARRRAREAGVDLAAVKEAAGVEVVTEDVLEAYLGGNGT